jgi:putative aldouronate transport system substrate-binding protein
MQRALPSFLTQITLDQEVNSMEKNAKRMLCFLALLTALGMIFAGCVTAQPSVASASVAPSASEAASQPPADDSITSLTLPLVSSPLTLTYWCGIPEDAAASIANFADAPLYKELAKRTGITLQFTHPVLGQEQEQFNLMVASSDLPDIIEWDLTKYPGGAAKAISDNVIISLNDLIAKYAPNLRKIVNGTDDVDKIARKMMMTDDGQFYMAPYMMLDNIQVVWHGPQIRQDMLDAVGLPVPETIDEWTAMLMKFKEQLSCPAPFSVLASSSINWLYDISHSGFAGAYGVCTDFYLDNSGAIQYGPIQPGFKDYLTLLASWYSQKLLDQDFATQDRKTLDAKVTSGQVGSYIGNAGGSMGRYLDALGSAGNTTIKLTGAPWPVLRKGDVFRFGQKDQPVVAGVNVSVSSANKHLKETMELLDYGYSDEGHMLFNFGIEGESYTMVDGYPAYTDLIKKNPNGLTSGQALSVYMRSVNQGPFVSDVRYWEQYAISYPQQKDAVTKWSNPGLASAYLPPISATADESKTVSQIMNDVTTYTQEMFYKFVMGQEPLSNYDTYVSKVQGMGIDQVVSIYTGALDRYNKR